MALWYLTTHISNSSFLDVPTDGNGVHSLIACKMCLHKDVPRIYQAYFKNSILIMYFTAVTVLCVFTEEASTKVMIRPENSFFIMHRDPICKERQNDV